MSVTADEALAAIKARVTGLAFPIYWQGDDAPTLPDDPAPFAFVVFNNDGSGRGPVAFGGGVGRNLYRNTGAIEAYVFSPIGSESGAEKVMQRAEAIAALLRSWRTSEISFTSADVIYIGEGSKISVPGLSPSPVNNYQCAVAECAFHFDQIG